MKTRGTSGRNVRKMLGLLTCTIALLAPRLSGAQSALEADLSSPDLSVRQHAVAQLSAVSVDQIPATTRAKLIGMLESEGVALLRTKPLEQVADSAEYEELPSYLANLVMVVLRLNDPASLRGLCLIGLTVNRSVQDFVVSHAHESIPFLEEAWHNEMQQHGVLETWGTMLRSTTSGLSNAEQQGVLEHLLDAQTVNPLGLFWAAKIGGLVDFASLVDSVRVHAGDEIVSTRATSVSAELRATAFTLSASDLLQRTQHWLTVLCAGATGARRGACTSLAHLLSDASGQIARGDSRAARSVLNAYVQRATTASRDGTFAPAEAVLLIENATTIMQRG